MRAGPPSLAGADIAPDLRGLASLDTAAGVRRIGGKADAYRRQLRRFRTHYADAVDQLRGLLAAPDTRPASDFCHLLKGVTGNIGAQALYAQVARMEAQIKQEPAGAEAELQTLQTLLQQVLQDIDSLGTAAQPSDAPTACVVLDANQLREHLDGLRQALSYDLGSAEKVLAQVQQGVRGTPLQADLAAIAAKVDLFEIDAAQLLLTQLQRRLQNAT
jgi:HPt (histidine-containing phosphotransfer) domain-containing protein